MSDLMFRHHLCQCKAQGRSRSCNMGPNPLCKLPSSIIKCRVMGEEWGIIWHKVSILKIGMPVPVGFLVSWNALPRFTLCNVTCKYSKIFFLVLYEILGRSLMMLFFVIFCHAHCYLLSLNLVVVPCWPHHLWPEWTKKPPSIWKPITYWLG